MGAEHSSSTDSGGGWKGPLSAVHSPLSVQPVTHRDSISARLAKWNRRRDPSDLWPGLSAEQYWMAVRRLVKLTGDVLANREPDRLTISDGLSVQALGVAGFTTGVGPLVGYWIEQGVVQASEDVAVLFGEHLEHGRRRAARLSHKLEQLLTHFEEQQLRVTVLKGSHLGRDYYPDPGTRASSDIDLLVDENEAEKSSAILSQLGFVSDFKKLPPQRAVWHLPGQSAPRSLELTHADNPWSVDLHSTLDRNFIYSVVGSFGRLTTRDRIPWSPYHQTAYSMASPSLLSFLAFHASGGFARVRLILLVDMVMTIRRDIASDQSDWADFEHDVRERNIVRFVYPALSLVNKLVPGIVCAETMNRLGSRTPHRIRHHVASATPMSTQRLHDPALSDRLMWLTSSKEILRFLWGVIWPRYPHASVPTVYRIRLRSLWVALRNHRQRRGRTGR